MNTNRIEFHNGLRRTQNILCEAVTTALAAESSVAISWQLNVAPYLCGVHKPCPLLREETEPVINSRFRL